MRLFSRTQAKVSFAGHDHEWPVLWIDDERFSLGASCAAQGATLDATLTFARTYRMTIPVRAEIPTRSGQTFQVLEMPEALGHMFRRLVVADYSQIGDRLAAARAGDGSDRIEPSSVRRE